MSKLKYKKYFQFQWYYILSLLFVFSSCAQIGINIDYSVSSNRSIASRLSTKNCSELMVNLAQAGYEANIRRALESKELVHRSHGRLTIQRPRASFLTPLYNRTQRFFSRVINDNRYPAYYIFDEAETTSKIIAYIRGLANSEVSSSTNHRDAVKDFGSEIQKWLDDYQEYQKQLDDLVKTRVSIAYNLNILKHYKNDAPDVDRVSLTFYRNGQLEETIFTFRREDDNLSVLIRDLESELKRFDGGFFTQESRDHARLNFDFFNEGAIRERVLLQSQLRDKILILNREAEFAFINLRNQMDSETLDRDSLANLELLYNQTTSLLNDSAVRPSTWATTKISRDKMLSEMRQSISSNRRLARLREQSSVMSGYLDELDISRARLTTRGLGFYTRAAYFLTPGALTFSGVFAVFNLDEQLSQLYNSYLSWRYGKKMECVRKRSEDDFLDCLYSHYESEYPDIIRLALRDPNFNPWDFELLARTEGLDQAIVSLYVDDVQEMMKFRQYFVYIERRQIEIRDLFESSHRDLISVVDFDADNTPPCISVSTDDLGLCLYNSVLSRLLVNNDKDLFEIPASDFNYQDFDSIPVDIKDDYIEEIERIVMMRAIYQDLGNLPDYQIHLFSR
jgi:hypothetical protein